MAVGQKLDLPPGLETEPAELLRRGHRDQGRREIPSERDARRALRRQVAKLERELGDTLISSFPHDIVDVRVAAHGGPRLLTLGELERLRDALSVRLRGARRQVAERAEFETDNRVLLERMLLDPERYRFCRIAQRDIGERGCGVYEVRPRLGLIGMLAGWWQVKLSSGCPLAGGPRGARPRSRPPAR